jgi:hypothetical protein
MGRRAGIVRQGDTPLLRGTLTTFRRRCGKANCHCAAGAPHESLDFLGFRGNKPEFSSLES